MIFLLLIIASLSLCLFVGDIVLNKYKKAILLKKIILLIILTTIYLLSSAIIVRMFPHSSATVMLGPAVAILSFIYSSYRDIILFLICCFTTIHFFILGWICSSANRIIKIISIVIFILWYLILVLMLYHMQNAG